MRSLWLLLAGLGLAACANTMAKIIPIGEPVTVERCQTLDMHKIGLKDGQEDQRRGEKYDFWLNDCRAQGVHLDRDAYDKGYDEGFHYYCSCEAGVSSAVHGEVLGLKGQYFSCNKDDYRAFERGFGLGEPLAKDQSLVKVESVSKTTYFEENINKRAKEECAKPIVAKPDPTPTPVPTPEPKSPRPFDPDKKSDSTSP